MSFFMRKYIERIVDVEGDNNYDFRVVSDLLDMGEGDYQFVRRHLIQEMDTHSTQSYMGTKQIIMQFSML